MTSSLLCRLLNKLHVNSKIPNTTCRQITSIDNTIIKKKKKNPPYSGENTSIKTGLLVNYNNREKYVYET